MTVENKPLIRLIAGALREVGRGLAAMVASGVWVLVWAALSAALSDISAARAAGSAPAPRRALLVGIGDYPQRTNYAWPRLHTAVEIAMLKRVLIERYSFREQDVLVLQDQEATAQHIREAFRQHLIAHASPGAVLYFHFSGHGQQVLDQNGDELDGLDESLVPVEAEDSRAPAGAQVNIRDDELGEWLKEIQTRMKEPNQPGSKPRGSMVVSIDSCFSGTAKRGGLLVERGRGWDEAVDGPLPSQLQNEPALEGRERAAGLRELDDSTQFLAATQGTQTAKERDRGNVQMGVFTWALLNALERASSKTTYRTLRDEIVYDVMAETRDQLPQLDGDPDRLLLGGLAAPAQSYIPLLKQRGEELILGAGSLHLVTVGSTYALHRAGSEPMSPATLVAQATVVAVSPQESTLRLLPELRGKVQPLALRAARAVETTHMYPDWPLRIFLSSASLSSLPAPIAAAMHGHDISLVPSARSADLWIDADAKSGEVRVYRPNAAQPIYTADADGSDGLERLFRREWRFRQLLTLKQDCPEVRAEVRLVPMQVTLDAKGAVAREPVERKDLVAAPGRVLTLRAGDYYTFELHNPTARDVWVTVLELKSDGRVGIAFPSGSNKGEPLKAGARKLLSGSDLFRVSAPFGRSIFKVLVTAARADLSGLVQDAVVRSCEAGASQRGLLLNRFKAKLAHLPPFLRPLSHLLADKLSGQRSSAPADLALGTFSISTLMLDQIQASGDAGAPPDPCESALRKSEPAALERSVAPAQQVHEQAVDGGAGADGPASSRPIF